MLVQLMLMDLLLPVSTYDGNDPAWNDRVLLGIYHPIDTPNLILYFGNVDRNACAGTSSCDAGTGAYGNDPNRWCCWE